MTRRTHNVIQNLQHTLYACANFALYVLTLLLVLIVLSAHLAEVNELSAALIEGPRRQRHCSRIASNESRLVEGSCTRLCHQLLQQLTAVLQLQWQ
jgi:hypothetical protein